MTTIKEQTLASIVSNNHQTVPVLEKYQLDFCCRGKRTLAEACTERGLNIEGIIKELECSTGDKERSMPFTSMTAEQLISHILIHHHFYVKQSMPTIIGHLEKVAGKHFDRFPYMIGVLNLFREVEAEMTLHMHKEEAILFPRIKEMEALLLKDKNAKFPKGHINGPIIVMEMEHEQAGDALSRIRELTNDYTAPADACTTFRVSLAELKEFEEDLHKHVHLENNILFPMAQKMLQVG
jgi:regulator of cell morphogenesis and NO signaling